MRHLTLAALLASVCAQSAHSQAYLYQGRLSTDRSVTLEISQPSTHAAQIDDYYEEDPFGREKKYKETTVSCSGALYLLNTSKERLAVEDPFATIFGLTIERQGKENITVQGNLGMTSGFPLLEAENIIQDNEGYPIDAVSMEPKRFLSREEAEAWVNEGGCDLSNVTAVAPSGRLCCTNRPEGIHLVTPA